MTELVPLLEMVLGESVEKNKNNYAFTCPFCHHYKKKLEVNIRNSMWNCWVCQAKGKQIIHLLKRLNVSNATLELYRKIVPSESLFTEYKKKDSLDNLFDTEVNDIITRVNLPKEYIPLYEPSKNFYYKTCINYLSDRGVFIDDIFKYRLGYCIDGLYAGMIIFPNYNSDGVLNFFSSRSYMRGSNTKFRNNDISRNVIGFELQISPSQPLILVESALDAIVIKRNASPLYGKQLLSSIKEYLLINEVEDVYICLDADALQDTIAISEYLINNGINIYFVKLPDDEDPNSLGYTKMWQLIESTPRLELGDLFTTKIQKLLW